MQDLESLDFWVGYGEEFQELATCRIELTENVEGGEEEIKEKRGDKRKG